MSADVAVAQQQQKADATTHDPAMTAEAGATDEAGATPDHQPDDEKEKKDVNDKKDDKNTADDSDKKPGGYDPTPLPRPSDGPGYTLRITFHSASNLPVADLSNSSSDPFIHATLTTDLPMRHKEDPLLVHRTRTIHRTTEPVWDEDWIVAGVPRSGFRLKCRLYDEDSADHDDRLGNVTYSVGSGIVGDKWAGIDHATFDVKKRMGSKRAYLLKAAASALTGSSITAKLVLSIQVVGPSEAPGGRVYTVGPTTFVRHFSPMIGRLTKTLVNKDEREDEQGGGANADEETKEGGESGPGSPLPEKKEETRTKKYDFQANEIQLQGPTPEQLYHRYVEFRPIIGRMFSSHGLRGHILNKAMHKQHSRVYNFGRTTEYGSFPPCSEQASLQFLKLVHFDEGGRLFTYMISLDGVFRFTETGKEFGIDMLSKHTMHADVATYIAFSGEFFIRRLGRPLSSAGGKNSATPPVPTHPVDPIPGGPPNETPPHQPGYYQLIIDNDSGTYRPDKAQLPHLQKFLEKNFPGLGVVAMHWEDPTLQELKQHQRKVKKNEGLGIQMVLNRSPSNSSFSSSDESRLSHLGHDGVSDDEGGGGTKKSKKELAWDLVEDPARIKDLSSAMFNHSIGDKAKK